MDDGLSLLQSQAIFHAAWLRRYPQLIDVMLAQGDLLLVIGGDDIHEDLLRLARRFAAGHDPLSLDEMCLVSMAVYRRGDETLFVPSRGQRR